MVKEKCPCCSLWLGIFLLSFLASAVLARTAPAADDDPDAPRWWKGNLHAHTLWSDGDHFPEMVALWYREHDYHFLALSDHNRILQGDRWREATDEQRVALAEYRACYGDHWVETREDAERRTLVRLKPLSEIRHLVEQPGRFLLMQAQEISKEAHLNAVNLLDAVPPQGGQTIAEILQNNVDAVLRQQERTGQSLLVFVNHPNFQWSLTAGDLFGLSDTKFFEVYNAHGAVRNEGDDHHCSTERMWDIILARRLTETRLGVMHAVATDDAHHYHHFDAKAANPGQAWIMVRARRLTPESILGAIDSGRFYCSTGVVLDGVHFENRMLTLQIHPRGDETYTTCFIGTRRGFDTTSRPVLDAKGVAIRTTPVYSDDIGEVLATIEGTTASYTLSGDEIYVRARVTSSRINEKSHVPGERVAAWVQPVVVR